MQCPVCLNESKMKKKIKVTTDEKPIVSVDYHSGSHGKANVGLDYNGFSQIYADVCPICGYIERFYIDV
jgi:hypothetical protein